MLLKSYRYRHEKTCLGNIEGRPVRAKAKPKATPHVQKAVFEEAEREASRSSREPGEPPLWKKK